MRKSIPATILSRLGLIGSPGSSSLLPRANTPQSAQELYRDFTDAGRVADPDLWARYNSVMKRPATFDSMLNLWEEMAGWELLAAMLNEIVDESIQCDNQSPATLWYQCNDKDFESELNDMLLEVGSEEILPSQVYNVAALGNNFEKIHYASGKGVMGLSHVHPMDVRRLWLEKNQRCLGYRWSGHKPSKEAAFVMPDNRTPIPRYSMADGRSTEDLWYPFDFMHMRRMNRNRLTQHGEPLFSDAEGIYKKLKIAIDQMVVHRAQVQPDRYVVNIDVRDQAPAEAIKTVQRWKQGLRSKLAFGQSGDPSGNNTSKPTDFSSFYNAWSLDTILYVAKPRDFQHSIEKIAGTTNVPDVYDIEFLTDMFYSVVGMPRSWFSSKEAGENPSGKALLAKDIRFLRKVKSIRKPIINGYTELGYMHAALRGKDIRQLDIKAHMPPIGGLEDQMTMELLMKQGEVLSLMGDIMEKYHLPREAWIEVIFRKYLHLPDEVINILVTALPPEMEQATESVDAPSTRVLLREVQALVATKPGLLKTVSSLKVLAERQDVKDLFEQKNSARIGKYMANNLFAVPEAEDNDIIVSSFGANPLRIQSSGTPTEATRPQISVPASLMESFGRGVTKTESTPTTLNEGSTEPAYRKFIPTTSQK